MNYWWCNQSRDWTQERSAGVVCSSDAKNSTYRKTVGDVKPGDLIIHYCKPNVVAISRAKEFGQRYEELPPVSGKDYGSGWRFETEYFDLSDPVHKSSFVDALIPLRKKHYPINRNGNVQTGYFFPFDRKGFERVLREIPEHEQPVWIRNQSEPEFPLESDLLAEFEEQVDRSRQSSHSERLKRLEAAKEYADRVHALTMIYLRNPDVVAEVLHRANGVCESCQKPAPFLRASNGSPYLEVHHKLRLADGGADIVGNAIALCPNCHRDAHFGSGVQDRRETR